jgi:hypothetical protein
MFNFNFSTWKLPHFLTVLGATVGAAIAGAVVTYIEAVPAAQLLQALTTPAGISALLRGALSVGLIAGLTALIGVAKQMLPTTPTPPSSSSKLMSGMVGVLMLFAIGCANLPAIVQDIANIAQTVIVDVMAGQPFTKVLADTGTEDASLLVAILTGLVGDPNPSNPAQAAAYKKACAPYLAQAKALAAQQKAAGMFPESRYRVVHSGSVWALR